MEVYNLVVYLNHKQFLPQNKDSIDRIARYGSSVENKEFGNQKLKEKLLEKLLE